jgi:hypothetical protein
MKTCNIGDWLLPLIFVVVVILFMNFWSDKTDREIDEYIKQHPQSTMLEMK